MYEIITIMMNYFVFYLHDLRLVHPGHQTEQRAMLSASLTSWVMSKVVGTPPEDLLARLILGTRVEYRYLAFTISPEINTNTNQVVYCRIGPLIQQSREQRTEWVDDKPNFDATMWP